MVAVTELFLLNFLLLTVLAVDAGNESQNVMKLIISKITKPGLHKRANGFLEDYIQNEHFLYMAILEIGSNLDPVALVLDTGSSDLWVIGSNIECTPSSSSKREDTSENSSRNDWLWPLNSIFGQSLGKRASKSTSTDKAVCTNYGSFNTELSDTFVLNSQAPQFQESYGDGTQVVGVWGMDNVVFEGQSITGVNIAVAQQASSSFGILGIGLETLESDNSLYGYINTNFPATLKSQGIISKMVYSLYLGGTSETAGSIVFGGVDNAKYSGTLTTVPILSSSNQFTRFLVAVDGIELSDNQTSALIDANTYSILLDSGTTLAFFPGTLIDTIGESLGGVFNSDIGYYEVPCTNDPNFKITFNLSGYKLNVPVSDLLAQTKEKGICLLEIEVASDIIIFGDIILRHAYWVYDLDDLEISVADVVLTNDEDVVEIISSVPGATQAAGYSNTVIAPYQSQEANPTLFPYSTGTPNGPDKLILTDAMSHYYFTKGYADGPNTISINSSDDSGVVDTYSPILVSISTILSFLFLL